MTTLVVDASVAAKWLLAEPDTEQARAILRQWTEGSAILLAPEIVQAEIANVLWKRVQRKLIPSVVAVALFQKFQSVRPILLATENLTLQAFELALLYRIAVYDCLYLALALANGCEFWTADDRLHRALSSEFPQVRLLQDWRP